jgi:hypothetical protein
MLKALRSMNVSTAFVGRIVCVYTDVAKLEFISGLHKIRQTDACKQFLEKTEVVDTSQISVINLQFGDYQFVRYDVSYDEFNVIGPNCRACVYVDFDIMRWLMNESEARGSPMERVFMTELENDLIGMMDSQYGN